MLGAGTQPSPEGDGIGAPLAGRGETGLVAADRFNNAAPNYYSQ
jgi:hypothetical protein